jgi:hypothetical protein
MLYLEKILSVRENFTLRCFDDSCKINVETQMFILINLPERELRWLSVFRNIFETMNF